MMLQLGMKMWQKYENITALPFDPAVWNAAVDKCAENGVNALLIDVGEGIALKSHPELAVDGSWTADFARAEVKRLRSMGIEPIPKLNFSATHDYWLGKWSLMVCTPEYYKVCAEVIDEVRDIFGGEYLHIGMDEEEMANQINTRYAVVRQFDLWWHDVYFYIESCEKSGVRPIIWSDYANNHLAEYLEKMPKNVVQNHWYYWNYWGGVPGRYEGMDLPQFQYPEGQIKYYEKFLAAHRALAEAGYDMLPAGSIWNCAENFPNLAEYARATVADDKLLGFIQTPWLSTEEANREKLLYSIELVGRTRKFQENK